MNTLTICLFLFAETGTPILQQPHEVKDALFHRVDLIRRNVKNLLKIAKRDTWVCDRFPYTPHGEAKHFDLILEFEKISLFICIFLAVSGYDQVTKFLQGYLDNELNFNDEETCTNKCEDYTQTRHVRCADKTLCTQNRNENVAVCSGEIRDCREIDSEDIQVCFADNAAVRRYHYFKYGDGQVHGRKPNLNDSVTECSSIKQVILFQFLNYPKSQSKKGT